MRERMHSAFVCDGFAGSRRTHRNVRASRVSRLGIPNLDDAISDMTRADGYWRTWQNNVPWMRQ